jgi:hypothetical protein
MLLLITRQHLAHKAFGAAGRRCRVQQIVLSNSLGTTRAMWQPQIEALTAHFRVLRYDTHG